MTGPGRACRPAAALLATAAVLLAACSGTAVPTARSSSAAPPSTQASLAELASRSDELFAREVRADQPGCSAAVGLEGDVVWAAAGGLADLDSGRLVETTTTFEIGSTSKQFTATTVLLLAQEGRLSVDDPLERWLPDQPAWAGDVTVAQAMHHVSGIPDFSELWPSSGVRFTDHKTSDDAMAAIATVEDLEARPGERFAYSNSNYVLLAAVVEAVTGRPLADVASELVFEPLGLDMRFDPTGWSPDRSDATSARGYRRNLVANRWDLTGSRWESYGDRGIQTTPSELVRWADNYRTGELGGEDLLAAQLDDAVDGGDGRYGAGIVQAEDGTLWHDGVTPGFLTTFALSADRRTAVAVTCNGERGRSSTAWYLSSALREEWGV